MCAYLCMHMHIIEELVLLEDLFFICRNINARIFLQSIFIYKVDNYSSCMYYFIDKMSTLNKKKSIVGNFFRQYVIGTTFIFYSGRIRPFL